MYNSSHTCIMESSQPLTELIFPAIEPVLLDSLTFELRRARQSPLYGLEHVDVFQHPDGLVMKLNKGERGFTFCRRSHPDETSVETFRAYLRNPVAAQYIPMTYEISKEGDKTEQEIVSDILSSYENAHGRALAAKIDWILWRQTSNFLIVLLPREIVARLMCDQGGLLTTEFRGRVGALRKIKALAPVLPEDVGDEDVVRRGLVTQYGKGAYLACYAIHQSVVREVCRHPGQGITIGPIGVWSP